jgi:transcriptional regulator with XRE-family HTH domain
VGFAEERALAEEAISGYERNAAGEPVFPAAADRIRRAREVLGLTQDDVASRWGEQPSMYWDLERFDDEVFTVISVRQLHRLASVLQTSMNCLLFGEEPTPALPTTHPRDVVVRIETRMREESITAEQLGDDVGWDLRPILTDAGVLADLPIVGLWSVCRAANVDWVSVMNTQQPA